VSIKVNRILSRKKNIAGIPAEVMIPAILLDGVVMVFGCLSLQLPPIPTAIFCLTLNIVWAILVARGVWRYLGTFYHPPRYFRANIRYKPFLQELLDRDSRPIQTKPKKRRSRR
jgi:hypothetical protein